MILIFWFCVIVGNELIQMEVEHCLCSRFFSHCLRKYKKFKSYMEQENHIMLSFHVLTCANIHI